MDVASLLVLVADSEKAMSEADTLKMDDVVSLISVADALMALVESTSSPRAGTPVVRAVAEVAASSLPVGVVKPSVSVEVDATLTEDETDVATCALVVSSSVEVVMEVNSARLLSELADGLSLVPDVEIVEASESVDVSTDNVASDAVKPVPDVNELLAKASVREDPAMEVVEADSAMTSVSDTLVSELPVGPASF